MTVFKQFKPFHYPIHWKFQDPDTGALFAARTKEALVRHIVTYRHHNQLPPIESLDIVLENYLCGQPINAGGCRPVQLTRSLSAYIKGGVALLHNLITNKLVHQEEADRRSKICISCLNNVFPDKDNFVLWSDKTAEASIGFRRSVHHAELGNCGDGKLGGTGCGCPLRAKVWNIPPFKLAPHEERQMRGARPQCWQLPENLKDMLPP